MSGFSLYLFCKNKKGCHFNPSRKKIKTNMIETIVKNIRQTIELCKLAT